MAHLTSKKETRKVSDTWIISHKRHKFSLILIQSEFYDLEVWNSSSTHVSDTPINIFGRVKVGRREAILMGLIN